MGFTIGIIAVIVLVVGYRLYRQMRERRWSLVGMWIAPAILFAIMLAIVAADTRASALAPLAALVGLGIGAGIGYYQGTHTSVRVDKATRSLYVKVSPIGILIFVAVLALRIGVRFATGGFPPTGAPGGASAVVSPLALVVSGALLAVAVGTIGGLRLYIWRRYHEALAATG